MGVSVFTPPQPGRRKKDQNAGNHSAYSVKPTSPLKFLGFAIFYCDSLYFLIFCYFSLFFLFFGHSHMNNCPTLFFEAVEVAKFE